MDATQIQKVLPYLPVIASHLAVAAVSFTAGYVFNSWLKRSQPGQAELIGKTLLAAILIVLYTGSVTWEMITPGYKAPWQFHAIIMVIVGSIFPKKFVSFGRLVDSITQGEQENEPVTPKKRRARAEPAASEQQAPPS